MAEEGAEEEAEGEEIWKIDQAVALYVDKWITGQESVDIENETSHQEKMNKHDKRVKKMNEDGFTY